MKCPVSLEILQMCVSLLQRRQPHSHVASTRSLPFRSWPSLLCACFEAAPFSIGLDSVRLCVSADALPGDSEGSAVYAT